MNLIGQGPRIVLHPSSATLTVMARTYRLPPRRRTLNRLVRVLLSIGLGPPRTYLLTVRGRRSGRLYSTPVTLVEDGGLRWLVAPYGDVAWARNAKAAGEVTPRRGQRVETIVALEVPPEEAAPVLKRRGVDHQALLRRDAPVRPCRVCRRSPPPSRLPDCANHGRDLLTEPRPADPIPRDSISRRQLSYSSSSVCLNRGADQRSDETRESDFASFSRTVRPRAARPHRETMTTLKELETLDATAQIKWGRWILESGVAAAC